MIQVIKTRTMVDFKYFSCIFKFVQKCKSKQNSPEDPSIILKRVPISKFKSMQYFKSVRIVELQQMKIHESAVRFPMIRASCDIISIGHKAGPSNHVANCGAPALKN